MARTVNPIKTEERKQQILHAAGKCFANKGFHKTSMADIFKQAKLSAGAVYHYFASKDAIIQHFAEQQLVAAQKMAEEITTATSIDEVVATCINGTLYEDWLGDPQVYMEVVCEAGRNWTVGKVLWQANDLVLTELKKKLSALGADKFGVSASSLATFLGCQMTALGMYKMENPSQKQMDEMAQLHMMTMLGALSFHSTPA